MRSKDFEIQDVEFVSHTETQPIFKLTQKVANQIDSHLVIDGWSNQELKEAEKLPTEVDGLKVLINGNIYTQTTRNFVIPTAIRFTVNVNQDQKSIELIKVGSTIKEVSKFKMKYQGSLVRVEANHQYLAVTTIGKNENSFTLISLRNLKKAGEISVPHYVKLLAIADDVIIYSFSYSNANYNFVKISDPTSRAEFAGFKDLKYLKRYPNHVFMHNRYLMFRVPLKAIQYQPKLQRRVPADGISDFDVDEDTDFEHYQMDMDGGEFKTINPIYASYLHKYALVYYLPNENAVQYDFELIDLDSMKQLHKFTMGLKDSSGLYNAIPNEGIRTDLDIRVFKDKTIKIFMTFGNSGDYLVASVFNGKVVVRRCHGDLNLGDLDNIKFLEEHCMAKVVSSSQIRIKPAMKH